MLDALIITALGKALENQAKGLRALLTPGEHTVAGRVILDYEGKVQVGDDEQYIPTVAIPLKVAMALFLRYAGVTGPHAQKALMRAMKEALEIEAMGLADKKSAYDAIKELSELDDAEQEIRKGLDALPPKVRRGKVGVKMSVVEVEEKVTKVA